MNNQENPVIAAANKYLRDSAQFLSMRQLGIKLGVTSHVIGKKLKEVGLRDAGGRPTDKAREGGFTKLVPFQETFALDVWHEEKTLAVLRPLIMPK